MTAEDGPLLRVGQGFDSHRFARESAVAKPLVLGGVVIAGEPSLEGHSDADAVAHAAADALLGAAGLPDIGEQFPDSDPALAGADSMGLLAQAVELVKATGFDVINLDTTVVCETPNLAVHLAAMRDNLAGTLGAPCNVKAKRPEQMGALGRGEGIACIAVALIASRDAAGNGSINAAS